MILSIVIVLALAGTASAQTEFDPGIGVGVQIPHFELADPDGKLWTFDTLKGEQGLVLQFFAIGRLVTVLQERAGSARRSSKRV